MMAILPIASDGSARHRRFGYTGFHGCNHGIHLSSGPCSPFGLRGASMWVRLTRRLADRIDGVNLSAHQVGDVFEVARHEAELLLAEAWAVLASPAKRPSGARAPLRFNRVTGGCPQPARLAEQLRTITKHINHRTSEHQYRRRAEDRIRDEWHDAHASVITHNGDTSR